MIAAAERQRERRLNLGIARYPAQGKRHHGRIAAGPHHHRALAAQVAEIDPGRAARIAVPNLWLRIGSISVIVVGLIVVGYVASIIDYKHSTDNLFGVLQGIEALINIVVLMGAAIFFMRSSPAATSGTILFIPATTMTFPGPKVIALVRLPMPSRLTSSPVIVRALVLVRNKSAVI